MPIDLRRIFLRKPQFVYFWDWSERLVTAGLWRGVELRCYRQARITDFRAYEDFHEDGSVTVHLEAETDGGRAAAWPFPWRASALSGRLRRYPTKRARRRFDSFGPAKALVSERLWGTGAVYPARRAAGRRANPVGGFHASWNPAR